LSCCDRAPVLAGSLVARAPCDFSRAFSSRNCWFARNAAFSLRIAAFCLSSTSRRALTSSISPAVALVAVNAAVAPSMSAARFFFILFTSSHQWRDRGAESHNVHQPFG
jgi:hypothetical protein